MSRQVKRKSKGVFKSKEGGGVFDSMSMKFLSAEEIARDTHARENVKRAHGWRSIAGTESGYFDASNPDPITGSSFHKATTKMIPNETFVLTRDQVRQCHQRIPVSKDAIYSMSEDDDLPDQESARNAMDDEQTLIEKAVERMDAEYFIKPVYLILPVIVQIVLLSVWNIIGASTDSDMKSHLNPLTKDEKTGGPLTKGMEECTDPEMELEKSSLLIYLVVIIPNVAMGFWVALPAFSVLWTRARPNKYPWERVRCFSIVSGILGILFSALLGNWNQVPTLLLKFVIAFMVLVIYYRFMRNAASVFARTFYGDIKCKSEAWNRAGRGPFYLGFLWLLLASISGMMHYEAFHFKEWIVNDILYKDDDEMRMKIWLGEENPIVLFLLHFAYYKAYVTFLIPAIRYLSGDLFRWLLAETAEDFMLACWGLEYNYSVRPEVWALAYRYFLVQPGDKAALKTMTADQQLITERLEALMDILFDSYTWITARFILFSLMDIKLIIVVVIYELLYGWFQFSFKTTGQGVVYSMWYNPQLKRAYKQWNEKRNTQDTHIRRGSIGFDTVDEAALAHTLVAKNRTTKDTGQKSDHDIIVSDEEEAHHHTSRLADRRPTGQNNMTAAEIAQKLKEDLAVKNCKKKNDRDLSASLSSIGSTASMEDSDDEEEIDSDNVACRLSGYEERMISSPVKVLAGSTSKAAAASQRASGIMGGIRASLNLGGSAKSDGAKGVPSNGLGMSGGAKSDGAKGVPSNGLGMSGGRINLAMSGGQKITDGDSPDEDIRVENFASALCVAKCKQEYFMQKQRASPTRGSRELSETPKSGLSRAGSESHGGSSPKGSPKNLKKIQATTGEGSLCYSIDDIVEKQKKREAKKRERLASVSGRPGSPSGPKGGKGVRLSFTSLSNAAGGNAEDSFESCDSFMLQLNTEANKRLHMRDIEAAQSIVGKMISGITLASVPEDSAATGERDGEHQGEGKNKKEPHYNKYVRNKEHNHHLFFQALVGAGDEAPLPTPQLPMNLPELDEKAAADELTKEENTSYNPAAAFANAAKGMGSQLGIRSFIGEENKTSGMKQGLKMVMGGTNFAAGAVKTGLLKVTGQGGLYLDRLKEREVSTLDNARRVRFAFTKYQQEVERLLEEERIEMERRVRRTHPRFIQSLRKFVYCIQKINFTCERKLWPSVRWRFNFQQDNFFLSSTKSQRIGERTQFPEFTINVANVQIIIEDAPLEQFLELQAAVKESYYAEAYMEEKEPSVKSDLIARATANIDKLGKAGAANVLGGKVVANKYSEAEEEQTALVEDDTPAPSKKKRGSAAFTVDENGHRNMGMGVMEGGMEGLHKYQAVIGHTSDNSEGSHSISRNICNGSTDISHLSVVSAGQSPDSGTIVCDNPCAEVVSATGEINLSVVCSSANSDAPADLLSEELGTVSEGSHNAGFVGKNNVVEESYTREKSYEHSEYYNTTLQNATIDKFTSSTSGKRMQERHQELQDQAEKMIQEKAVIKTGWRYAPKRGSFSEFARASTNKDFYHMMIAEDKQKMQDLCSIIDAIPEGKGVKINSEKKMIRNADSADNPVSNNRLGTIEKTPVQKVNKNVIDDDMEQEFTVLGAKPKKSKVKTESKVSTWNESKDSFDTASSSDGAACKSISKENVASKTNSKVIENDVRMEAETDGLFEGRRPCKEMDYLMEEDLANTLEKDSVLDDISPHYALRLASEGDMQSCSSEGDMQSCLSGEHSSQGCVIAGSKGETETHVSERTPCSVSDSFFSVACSPNSGSPIGGRSPFNGPSPRGRFLRDANGLRTEALNCEAKLLNSALANIIEEQRLAIVDPKGVEVPEVDELALTTDKNVIAIGDQTIIDQLALITEKGTNGGDQLDNDSNENIPIKIEEQLMEGSHEILTMGYSEFQELEINTRKRFCEPICSFIHYKAYVRYQSYGVMKILSSLYFLLFTVVVGISDTWKILDHTSKLEHLISGIPKTKGVDTLGLGDHAVFGTNEKSMMFLLIVPGAIFGIDVLELLLINQSLQGDNAFRDLYWVKRRAHVIFRNPVMGIASSAIIFSAIAMVGFSLHKSVFCS